MRTALIAAALTLLLALAAVLYHCHTVASLTAELQTERGKHAVTRSELQACKSASSAACAVNRATEGKADAAAALQDLITERKK